MSGATDPNQFRARHNAALAMLLLATCSTGSTDRDVSAFITVARQSSCADIRNSLYLVDSRLYLDSSVILHVRAGNCADASYAQTLYGDSVFDVLCTHHDSIAGPVLQCADPAYAQVFDVMITHLDEAHLGLPADFSVRRIPIT